MEASGSGVGSGGGGGVSNGDEMPGRLIMDQQGAVGLQDLKRDRSHAQTGTSLSEPPAVQAQHAQQPNRVVNHVPNGSLPNGVPASAEAQPTTNGESSSMAVALAGPDNPPPLDQSWREHHSNKSLGLMMERVAQQCYFDLNQTLTAMSEIRVEPQHEQPNGVVPHTAQDTSEGSLRKKRLIMDFANNQREHFIKTLVLSDWCRNEEDQGKLIDVKVWQVKQREAHAGATRAVGQTKVNMIPAKMPNPNIEGAMELLATGKVPWIPDLGYIPPKRLSAKQLLKTLRNMNVALATRLNLNDELSPYFQDFSVADGRATFTVRDEFEVDLSVAEEDPATPFYFIDIRLLFKPTSNILDDRLRGFLENRINHELATKGLKGCYEFLHNFVLTHKINLLRSHALELIRGKWFDCIRIENLRRSLVVQYWTGLPGPKSWIEIGISSGKQKGTRSRRPPTPQILVRWFRRGVEVKDEALEFDWRDLDLESCLAVVIGKHSAWIMNDLQSRIRSSVPAGSPLAADYSSAESTSEERTLLLSLPSMREPLRVRVEHVTGQYSISPPSPAAANTERRFNNDPTADAAKWLSDLLCASVQERVRKEALLLDWALARDLLLQDNLEKVFEKGLRWYSVFIPRPAWGSNSALAITFSLGGEKWWVVSSEDKRNEQGNVIGKVIATARRVPLIDKKSEDLTVSRVTLMRMEKLAVAEVAFGMLSKQLKDMRIPHKFEKLATPSESHQVVFANPSPSVALFIRFSPLMKDVQNKAWKPWADEPVRLTHHGIAKDRKNAGDGAGIVRHDLRLSLEPGKMNELQKHLMHSKEQTLALNTTGGLALRFLTPFGHPFVEQMQKRLQSVERLDGYVALLKARRFECTHVSLSQLAFTYSTAPALSAWIHFSNDGGLPAKLMLEPLESNPHRRIRVFLEKGLNETGNAGFQALVFMLSLTLPVLQTFERLETVSPAKRVFSVHPRTTTWYSVKYSATLPGCVFQLRAMTKSEGKKKLVRWQIRDMRNLTNGAALPEDLVKALKELWQDKGEHWEGLGNGIIADAQGIGAALEKVDEVVRRFQGIEESRSAKQAEPAEQPAVAPPQKPPEAQPKSQPQTQPQKTHATAQVQVQKQPQKPQKPANTTAPAHVKSEPDVIMLD